METYCEKVGYVLSSVYRLKILKILKNSIKTPKELSKKCHNKFTQVSTALSELRKEKLVECINEPASKHRLYRITELGFRIINFIENHNLKVSSKSIKISKRS